MIGQSDEKVNAHQFRFCLSPNNTQNISV